MQQAIDEDGVIWNVDASGNAVGPPVGRAPQQPTPQAGPRPFTVGTPRAPEPKAPYRFESNDGSIWEVGPDGQPRKLFQDNPAPKEGGAAPQSNANLRSVIDQINHIEALFNEHQKGVGLSSIGEYLPTQGNKAFDTAGAALGDMGTAAFKVPGMGPQSDADAARFVAANQPSRWDTDSQVQEKLGALRRRVDNALAAGNQPPAQWGTQYDPERTDQQGIPAAYLPQQGGPILPDARGAQGDNVRVSDEANVTKAGNGLMREPRLAGVGQELLSMVQAGRPLKEVLAHGDKRFQSVGFPGIFPEQKRVLEYAVGYRKANPSKLVTDGVKGWENYEMVPDTQSGAGARAMGAAATWEPGGVPVGNTATHFFNAAAAGVPTALAGANGADVVDASRRTMPKSSAVGDIGGSLAAMYGINKLGGALAQSGSRTAQLGGRALIGRGGIGGDMAYSSARGGAENGLEGAVLGLASGYLGNKIGSGIVNTTGRAVRGVSDPAVRYLSERGIPLTAGQLLGNRGITGRVMNKLESLPVIGDSLAARRMEGVQAFNRSAFEDAGRPIGVNPQGTGFPAVEQGLDMAGNAIGDSVAGLDLPIDPTGSSDIRRALAVGQRLPPDLAANFSKAVENRVAPAITGNRLTGEGYTQATRGIAGYRAEKPNPGFEQDYRDALTGVEDALTGVIDRQAGPEISSNLGTARTAYRDFKLLEDAVKKGQSGGPSGTPEVFTPHQLQGAVRASKYAKSGTSEPFYDLTKAAQEVLPSTIPNSGSADRGMAGLLLPAALGGTTAAAGYLDPKIAAPLALLTLLSSKGGAKIAQKALTGRSPRAISAGGKIVQQRRKAGLFGAATASAMMPQLTQ